jgi:RNA polymerase sigma factor (sigma-70 family)
VRAIEDGDQRLAELWTAHAPRLHAYARRHVDANDADDLVAEAYLVALRRIGDVPDDSAEAFAWLVVTVRKLAANQRRRAATRDQHWAQAVRDLWHIAPGSSPEDLVAERDRCLDALALLSESDRETLLLVAWEGLTPGQAAGVLGCSENAFSVRLHRARKRVAAALDTDSTPLRVVTSQGN